MSPTRLRIWCNQGLPDAARSLLERAVAEHELVLAQQSNLSNLATGASDLEARESDVAFGQPDPGDIVESRRLRWVQLSTAGYTRYDREDVRLALSSRGGIMSTSSTVYAEPCAQHVLGMMLALARRLPGALEAQHRQRWAYSPLRGGASVLVQQSVLVVGLGAIGRRLIELLRPFAVAVTGVRRTPRGDESVPTRTMDDVDDLLPQADHVVNLLPSGQNTRRFFHAARFARFKAGARFYNVGRGDTVDQDALIDALRSGRLGSAYLDVTEPEPLPADHPLWSTANCFITPHIAGGRQREYEVLVQHFLANLNRFRRGEPLLDRVV